MTVRTWFTISAVVIIALFGAVALKLAAPVGPPSIVVRSGTLRLPGGRVAACWPDGGGKIQCTSGAPSGGGAAPTLPRKGSLRVIVAYPLQPKNGTGDLELYRVGHVIFHRGWSETVPYDLHPGRYYLRALAEYPKQAHVYYEFRFRVA